MKEFDRLIRIMKRLRDPRRGCPWDLKQTPSSLKEYILEEAYELVEAIDGRDPGEMQKELGDLLLQIVFLSQIEAEEDRFSIRDVIESLTEKLTRRHPHIFADKTVSGADEVRQNWERIKMEERGKESVLSDYPHEMPSLLVANRLSSQASSVGFDWKDALQALEKVKEEIGELEREIIAGSRERAEDEIGDLLFAVANVARLLRINPEFALGKANRKFVRRFRDIESRLRERQKSPSQTTLTEMEELWRQSKQGEEE